MSNDYFNMAVREKAILVGLYLAKFDVKGLQQLGFTGPVMAFNIFGAALGVKPLSVRGYRDEFDPVFPNPRVGRVSRPMRPYCQAVLTEFGDLPLASFSDLLRQMLYPNPGVEQLLEVLEGEAPGTNSAFAQRLQTGLAAERYFQEHYPALAAFGQQPFVNTTALGCGFDFQVNLPGSFYGVEVKGLTERRGSIQLMEKEYRTANLLGDRYFLFVVKNFRAAPFHELIQNPLASHLHFTVSTRQVVQTSWHTIV